MSSEEDPVAWLRAQVEAGLGDARRDLGHARRPGYYGCQDSLCEEEAAMDRIARCEAELAILDEHRLVVADQGLPEQGQSAGIGGGWRIVHEHPTERDIELAPMMWWVLCCRACRVRVPCRTVRLLASGYRHRNGFPAAFAA